MTTPQSRLTATHRAWALTAVLGVAVVGLVVLTLPYDVLDPSLELRWLLLALGMAMAERCRVHLQVGRETLSFTLAELPTVVGLFFVWPVGVILARIVGTGLALVSAHSRNPLKLVFNVASGAVEAGMAVLAFHLVLPVVGLDSTWTYAAALGSMLLGSTFGVAMVWTIIRVYEGGRGSDTLGESMVGGLPLAIANSSIALFVVALLRVRPEVVWIALLPIVVLVITYRAYIKQLRHRHALDFLYDTAVEAQGQPEAHDALLSLVRRARVHLDAQVAELVVLPDPARAKGTGPHRAIVVSVGPGDIDEVRNCTVEDLPLEVREVLRAGDGPEDSVGPQEIWTRATGTTSGPILLRVRGPVSNVVTFDETDLEVMRSLTRLVTMTMDRAQLAELKAAFLTAVSHELRTPLTVVLGTASTLRARGDQISEEDRAWFLLRLEDQAHRLDRLLGDLLDLDRLNRGVIEARRRLVDLVPLVERAVRTLDVEHHDIEITADTVLAEVDPSLTERILENLIKNAVKYTPKGTSIRIGLEREGDDIVLRVDDEGAGVPEDLRASILDPFVRIDDNHPQPGTGIGLTLVRQFARLHDGDVTIEESPAGGARVVVRLRDNNVPEPPHERLLPA